MVERQSLHDGIRARLSVVSKQREAAEGEFNRLRQLESALETVLRLDAGEATAYPDLDLKALSINKGLVEIAKRNNNIVVTREAIGAFVDAGIYESRDDANGGIHTTLRRSHDFEKVEPGVYRYVGSNGGRQQPVVKATPKRERTPSGLGDLVEGMLRQHPSWGRPEVLAELKRQRYDFRDKNPSLAVNMAVNRIRKKLNGSHPQLSLVSSQ